MRFYVLRLYASDAEYAVPATSRKLPKAPVSAALRHVIMLAWQQAGIWLQLTAATLSYVALCGMNECQVFEFCPWKAANGERNHDTERGGVRRVAESLPGRMVEVSR